MTKEEIALQLTLTRMKDLAHTEKRSQSDTKQNALWNDAISNETVKMFNTIYNGIDLDSND